MNPLCTFLGIHYSQFSLMHILMHILKTYYRSPLKAPFFNVPWLTP